MGDAPEPRIGLICSAPLLTRATTDLFTGAGFESVLIGDEATDVDCYVVLVRTSRGVGEIRDCVQQARPGTPILAVTDYRDADLTADVLGAGATSVLPLDTANDAIVAAVKLALAGISTLETATLDWVMRNGTNSTTITDAERLWLEHLDQGITISQLAPIAGYSERSLYRQLNQLYHRLGATDRKTAVNEARRRNLL